MWPPFLTEKTPGTSTSQIKFLEKQLGLLLYTDSGNKAISNTLKDKNKIHQRHTKKKNLENTRPKSYLWFFSF